MLNKQEALEWCKYTVVDWPDASFKPRVKPEGWFWTLCNTNEMILVNEEFRTEYIDKRAWLHHKARPVVKITVIPNVESLEYLRRQMYSNHYPDHLVSADVSFGQMIRDLNR